VGYREFPIDYHNCVVFADLTREEADGEIEASLLRMRAHGVPGSWHVGPSMRPPDLGGRLIVHGFEYGGDDIGMAVDFSELPEGVPVPGNLVVERVRDEAGLAAWVEALGSGFGEGPVEAEWVGEMYRRLGFEGSWRHYLGRLAGEPVAMATSFFGVAGIYFVCTVERARRRGMGAAEMGYPVYRGLGFEEYCRIGLYEWRPG
jgi:hypothetical protein